MTPPTTFEYEDGSADFGIATMFTRVRGGPPNAVDDNRVLPYLNSVGIVDFNRDGLPDLVQGWSSQLSCGETYLTNPDPDIQECQNARPMISYLNRGVTTWENYLDYQCFGAGRIDDTTGLTHYNVNTGGPKPPNGFFTGTGGVTLVGSWGEGILAWSNAQYAPYRAHPLVPDYDLKLMSLASAVALPAAGMGLVVVAKIGGFYHARIFDRVGNKVIDKGKDEFLPDEVLVQELETAFGSPSISSQTKGELVQKITSSLDYSDPGTGCDADPFKKSEFHPGWKWEKTQSDVDWAKPAVTDPVSQLRSPRWFTDIDGDGLVDRLEDTGIRAFDFDVAGIEFTRRYGKNDPRPTPGVPSKPAQIPFAFDPGATSSLAPSAQGRSDTKFYYVDINGDGLVDLVTQNPNDNGGIPRVRPGDGLGHFWCDNSRQPWPCTEWPTEPSAAYEIDVTGSRAPWPFTEETYFHDVTGDGLADIIQYDMSSGEVRLWVNQDGHTFACVRSDCVAGKILDHVTGTPKTGEYRTTFADMNADGVDDIVVMANDGIYVGSFMKKYAPVYGFERGAAPRPGVLTRIHNGYGATTDIRYQTIQELDLKVKDTAAAWQYHSPVVESVVTQIITQDSYHAIGMLNATAPLFPFKRQAQYFYQNPAYDRWSRSFAGFRKVVARYGDEMATTATTYWFGPCQNNRLNARLPEAPNTPLCPEGSDDDDYRSLTGRVVRIDRGNDFLEFFTSPFFELSPLTSDRLSTSPNPVGPKLLWTKTFHYGLGATLFDRPDRRVTFSYPSQIDTYLYDDAQPTQSDGEISPVAGGDALVRPPRQVGIRKHLSRLVEYDNNGTLKRVTDSGAIKDEDSKPSDVADATTITLFSPKNPFSSEGPSGPDDTPARLPCTSNWQCLPDYFSVWEPQGSDPAKLLRKSHFIYTADGEVHSVEGWLDFASEPLERHHPAGDNSTAPKPAGQALEIGWHTFATLSYDILGNVTQTVSGQTVGGSPPSCTTIAYDKSYQHLPSVVRNFKDGCAGSALESQTIFDRGFGQVISSTAPNGSSSEIRLDRFGRPQQVYLPDPDVPSGNPPPVLAATIDYSDRSPQSFVDVRRIVGPGTSTRSVTIFNSLGEPVVGFDQGDNNDWVLNGWRETNLAGKVQKVRRPWAFTGDPITTAMQSTAIPVPSDSSLFEIRYDDFGRKASIKENGNGFSQELMRNSYFPLAVESRDAEQLKLGGLHEKAFQRVEFDGHGRSTRAVKHVVSPTADNIIITVKYEPTGEAGTITRTHAGSTYQRTMKFDTLGRLMVNKEPNTGNWRYVWDDAGRLVGTSDARGCGINFHYDGLGRLIGEDYSPCLASQPAYTPPIWRPEKDLKRSTVTTPTSPVRSALSQALTMIRDLLRGIWFQYEIAAAIHDSIMTLATVFAGSLDRLQNPIA